MEIAQVLECVTFLEFVGNISLISVVDTHVTLDLLMRMKQASTRHATRSDTQGPDLTLTLTLTLTLHTPSGVMWW